MCDASCKFTDNRTREHLLQHVKQNIPTALSHRDLHLLPSRKDFVIEDVYKAMSANIQSGKPIIFMPNTVEERNVWDAKRNVFKLYITGVMPCGSKTLVILEGVEVNFDIAVPADSNPREFGIKLQTEFGRKQLNYTAIKDITQYKLHGFQTEPCAWKRIIVDNLKDRKLIMNHIRDLSRQRKNAGLSEYETANDDPGDYFPKVARQSNFATADWNRIDKYEVLPRDTTTNCEYALKVHVSNYNKLDKQKRGLLLKNPILGQYIDRDCTMVAQWDIETHRTIQNGQVPTPDDHDFVIFMMCSAYFWHHSDAPLLTFCATDAQIPATDGINITVVCDTERQVHIAHMEMLSRMAPDITAAFNGGDFDWPLYREKLRRQNMLTMLKTKMSTLPTHPNENEENVLKWSFGSPKIKIDAETSHTMKCQAKFSGCIDTDVLPVFLKMYPKAEVRKSFSLNFFLKVNKLESKDDMPYKMMFKYYERSKHYAAMQNCHCSHVGDRLKSNVCACPNVREIDYILENEEYRNPKPGITGDSSQKCCHCLKLDDYITGMQAVAHYCVIDCIRPQQLYVKRTIVTDKRALSTMTYVSTQDSFYLADGMKVRNTIGRYCYKFNIGFSNARCTKELSEKDHYPGAWVFPPELGLDNEDPVTGMDFASLYPSLMMCYNHSPDMSISNRERAEELQGLGYTLHHIRPFPYERGEKKGAAENLHLVGEGWTVRHNGVFKPGQKTVKQYVKTVKYVAGKGPDAVTVTEEDIARGVEIPAGASRNISYKPIEGRDALPGERMGIFPYILKKIFDKRVPVKALFVALSKLEEKMELEHLETVEYAGVTYTHSDLQFQIAKVDATQKALKVLANTFYGESGNFRSSVYNILVAAGITTDGQYNIKLVAEMMRSRGFGIKYGDTDSVYATCPREVFADAKSRYETALQKIEDDLHSNTISDDIAAKSRHQAKIEFWTEKVKITMRVMNEMKEYIVDFLLADNGTLFLKMAYEEVGFPTVFTGKKKYFMTPHIDTINFYPEKYFIRGIDIIKQGQSDITKQLGHEFIAESLAPENTRTLIEIVDSKVRKYHEMEKPLSMFVLTAKYNTAKKNVPVHTFVRRMKTIQALYAINGPTPNPTLYALYEPPEPGDKFKYVVTKKDIEFTIQGGRVDKKKGDCMEYSRVFEYFQNTTAKMTIDVAYYMEKSIIGLFSRFIAYHADFQPPPGQYDISDKDQYREKDNYCLKKAGEYLERLSNQITGFQKVDVAAISRVYRKQTREINALVESDLAQRNIDIGIVQRVRAAPAGDDRVKKLIEALTEECKEFASVHHHIDVDPRNANGWIQSYTPHRKRAQYNYYDMNIQRITQALFTSFAHSLKFMEEYEIRYAKMIEDARLHGEITDDMITRANYMDPEHTALLQRLADQTVTLRALYMLRARFEYTDTTYRTIRDSRLGIVHDPKINIYGAAKQDAKSAAPIEPYVYG